MSLQPSPRLLAFLQDPQAPQGGERTITPTTERQTPTPGQQDPAGTPGQGQPGGAPQQPCGSTETFLYMGLFLALMWLLVFRPANKQRKEHQKLVSTLKKGDKVVTTGGIHGVVAALTERTVTLQIDTIRMEVDRSAIGRVERDGPAAAGGKGGNGKA